MAGVISATITGTIGDGRTLTSAGFSNLARLEINAQTAMVRLVDLNDKVTDISIAAATTITDTLSGAAGNHTVVIS